MSDENQRESGARHPTTASPDDPNRAFSQDAAANPKPAPGAGLSEAVDETSEKTRKSDGRGSVGEGHPAERQSGAAPALVEHTKDAHGKV
jgi:hypothetical protein